MKTKFFLIIYLFTTALPAFALSIGGRVVDAQTGESLPGAVVSFSELKISTSTNENGEFVFKNAPEKGRFIVEVRYIGYQTLTQQVDLANAASLIFKLHLSTMEAKEVVITGSASSSDNRRNSSSVALVGKEALIKQSTNIVDAISRIPGVSQISTGGGISKPVIRGLGYNRVITLADGAKQEGQQWGDEHGIEIDQFNVDRVEVLKGAASLLYGSDALGGVINMIDPLPAGDGQVKGEFLSNYATNNGLTGSSLMIHGNKEGLIWRIRGTYKSALAYKTPLNRIPNTGFNETNLSGQIGLNKKWGYAHLNLSTFRSRVGLPDFLPNDSGVFEDRDGNVLTDEQIRSGSLLLPYQDISHHKLAFNSNLLLGKNRLRANITYQNNLRKEFEENTSNPGLFFDLKTLSYDLKYYLEDKNGWEPVLGASGSFQKSENKGDEFLIPAYTSKDLGLFAYFKKSWEATTLNFGSRLDYHRIKGDELIENGQVRFEKLQNTFTNWSGAAGLTQEFNDRWSLKANIGSAFRSPNIAELGSNGVHEGTFRYEVGNPDLKPERSFYMDLSLNFDADKISAEWNVFYNNIHNYIYYRQNNSETIDIDTDTYPLFHFVQNNALLSGTEFSITLHPLEHIHLENSFAYTRGQNKGTRGPLPFIPAGVLRNEVRFEPGIRTLTGTYLSLGLDNYLAQNRTDSFEQPSAGYSILNASLGTSLMLGKQLIRIHVAGNNLLNKAYYDHLSRFKPGRLDESNPNVGFYNPGRNLTFGVYLPLNLK
ncbi:MAG: TonB-dependent receptor [Sphingobacteriaceae bacterium]